MTGRVAKRGLAATWCLMAVTQVVLLAMHPRLDAMLDANSISINDPALFHSIHELNLTIVGVQWTAGLIHLLLILISRDQNNHALGGESELSRTTRRPACRRRRL